MSFFKKMLFFTFLILFSFNVNALVCKYKIDDGYYGLTFDVNYKKTDWRKAYSFNSKKSINLFYINGSGQGGKLYTVYTPDSEDVFSKIRFGVYVMSGVCPVLVSIGNNEYTVMPFEKYNDYFSLSNTLECDSCNDNLINVNVNNGNKLRYTLENVCNYLGSNHNNIPFLSYFKYNKKYDNYNSIVGVCKRYKSGEEVLNSNTSLKKLFNNYENDFIFGEFDDLDNLCPLYSSKDASISSILKCLDEKSKVIKSSIDDFNNKCTESEMRSIQSYAGGSTSKFYDRGNISSYLNSEIKMMFSSFSEECSSSSDKLYHDVDNLGAVLYSYYNYSDINNTLSYLYLESLYYSGYSLLTNVNPDVKVSGEVCNLINDGVKGIINDILNALRVGCVVIVIFLSIIDVYKIVVSNDDKASKKVFSLIVKRIILLVLILFIPTIVMILIDFLNKYVPYDVSNCVINELNK